MAFEQVMAWIQPLQLRKIKGVTNFADSSFLFSGSYYITNFFLLSLQDESSRAFQLSVNSVT